MFKEPSHGFRSISYFYFVITHFQTLKEKSKQIKSNMQMKKWLNWEYMGIVLDCFVKVIADKKRHCLKMNKPV